MPTQVNYPLTKTVVSAEGSAEVIAYGSNDYTDIWGLGSLDTNWSLWDTFPTVVRVGNYVWCLWGQGSNSQVYWRLIDVVIDPLSNYEFGNNIAYPEISNTQTDSITNVQSAKLTNPVTQNTDITEGPYRPLAVTTEFSYSQSSPRAGVYSDIYSYKEFVPIFSAGTIESFNIALKNTSVSVRPLVRGWGDYSAAKGTDGNTVYGRFPPFATQQQFETLYGKEHNWQSPNSNSQEWLFEAESGSGASVYSGALTYPFTVAAMVPNTKYRNIPGDTTGDGIDNTPSSSDALLAIAAAEAILPELDAITKCIGIDFDIDIDLPDIDLSVINDAVNSVKAAVSSAVSSTGLSEIADAAGGLKDRLLASLPELPEFPNLAAELAKLNPLDSEAVQKLVSRWESVYSGVSGIIDDLSNFDVCSIVDVKAKVDKDGNLEDKPKVPEVPDKDIEEPSQNVSVPTNSHGLPQTDEQADRGISPQTTLDSLKAYNDAWRLVEKWDVYAKYMTSEVENLDKLSSLEARPEHQAVVSAPNISAAASSIIDGPLGAVPLPPYVEGISPPDAQGISAPLGDFGYIEGGVLPRLGFTDPPFVEGISSVGSAIGGALDEVEILTGEELVEAEKEVFAPLYIAYSIKKAIAKARGAITAKLMASNVSGITPDSDPSGLWKEPYLVDIGSPYPSFAGKSQSILAKFDEETRDTIVAQYVEINKAITKHVFTTKILGAAEDMVIGKASPHTKKNPTNVRSSERGSSGQRGAAGAAGDPGVEKAVYSAGRAEAPASGEVKYASYYKGQTRNQPLQQSLMNLLVAVAGAGPGYSFTIVSGGQDYKGRGRRRTGSIRHDGGFAADVIVYNKDGRILSGASYNRKDIAAMEELVKHFKANGITSIGAGPGYMGGNWHVDISPTAGYKGTWGRSHGRASTPGWLKNSFYS